MRGEHLVAPAGRGRAARRRRRPAARAATCGSALQVRLLQHQADVGMRDQHAVGVDDVGEAGVADLDLRDDVPDELQVHLGRGHAAAAAGRAGDRHVRLGALPEVDRAVVDRTAPSRRSRNFGSCDRSVPLPIDVHRQARDAQLLAAVRIDPDHLGDRRRLALQLQVLEAALLERVAVALGARQRRPAELVLDVDGCTARSASPRSAPSRPAARRRCASVSRQEK